MVQCIEQVSLQDVFDYRRQHQKVPADIPNPPEDIFFLHALEVLDKVGKLSGGLVLPRAAQAMEFSVEGLFHEMPIGIHGFDKNFLAIIDIRKVLTRSKLKQYANQSLLYDDRNTVI